MKIKKSDLEKDGLDWNISDFASRLKENELQNELSHCDAAELKMYPPGTKLPIDKIDEDEDMNIWQ